MKEKIAFVGAGRVGLTLSAYFLKKGLNVVSIYARSESSLKKAKSFLKEIKITQNINDLNEPDIIFITTKDDAIIDVALRLHQLYPQAHLVHTSGAHSSQILPGEKKASLHPMQSFADPEKAIRDIENTLFTLEGAKETVKLCESLLKKLNLKYTIIKGENKVFYHIAACIASNYLVTLFAKALECIKISGIEEELGIQGLFNLAMGTLNNIKNKGVPQALTGPIARKDKKTLLLHLANLKEYPNLLEFYRFLGEETARMIKAEDIKKLFKER